MIQEYEAEQHSRPKEANPEDEHSVGMKEPSGEDAARSATRVVPVHASSEVEVVVYRVGTCLEENRAQQHDREQTPERIPVLQSERRPSEDRYHRGQE